MPEQKAQGTAAAEQILDAELNRLEENDSGQSQTKDGTQSDGSGGPKSGFGHNAGASVP